MQLAWLSVEDPLIEEEHLPRREASSRTRPSARMRMGYARRPCAERGYLPANPERPTPGCTKQAEPPPGDWLSAHGNPLWLSQRRPTHLQRKNRGVKARSGEGQSNHGSDMTRDTRRIHQKKTKRGFVLASPRLGQIQRRGAAQIYVGSKGPD